jgi:glucokinase
MDNNARPQYSRRRNVNEGSVEQEDLSIAIDLGGTNMRVALVDRAGVLLQREWLPTQVHLGREMAFDRLTQAIARLMPPADGALVVGIGVSLASPVDPATGTMYNPPNLPGWDGFSLKPPLEEMFRIPVWVANDTTLAAVGERAYGAAKGMDNLVYMTVGTGIGGGIILNGKPLIGTGGFAGEIGHMSIDRNGPLCNCGNVGCLEALASGTAIANSALRRLEQGGGTILSEMVKGDLSRVQAKMVMEAAAQGDQMAREVVERFAEDLGLGIVNLLHIFDPQVVVLGGGVCRDLPKFRPALEAAVRRNVMAHLKERVSLVQSTLGDDASLLGAAYVVFHRGL